MAGVYLEFKTRDESALASLRRLERNLGPERLPASFVVIMKELEEYHGRTWGRGIKTLPETRIRWPDSKVLRNTEKLYDSMTEMKAEGAVRKIEPYGFKYGTDLYYAGFVDKGTVRQTPKPFLKYNTTVRRLISKSVTAEIMRGVL